MKEQKIIESVNHLQTCLEDINQQLINLHNNGVEFVFNIKPPYETKSGTKIEITRITKLVDYLKNE